MGETGYAQGDVTVPPEPTEPPAPYEPARPTEPPAPPGGPAPGSPVPGSGAPRGPGAEPEPDPQVPPSASTGPAHPQVPPSGSAGPAHPQVPPSGSAGPAHPQVPPAGSAGSAHPRGAPSASAGPAHPQVPPAGSAGPAHPQVPPVGSVVPGYPPDPSVREVRDGLPQALPARPTGPGLPGEPGAGAAAPAAGPPAPGPASTTVGPTGPGRAAAHPDRPTVSHLGDRAPTYAAEPGALPAADPAALDDLTPDTVLEGARYGTYTLRAASLRGDSARYRGEARRDALLTARFGSGEDALVLVVLAGGDRAAPGAREAAADLCHTVAAAVGRSRERLADDIRAGRREALRSGLQRLTDRGYGRLRARAAELGLPEDACTAGLRGLLLPLDPRCANRVCFGAGPGGVFRLRAGAWQDLEPDPAPPAEPGTGTGAGGFRFRASVARPGDTLLLCSGGLAEPMREEAVLPAELAARWSQGEPPGLAAFLADTQLRLKGYADDRTAAAVWEA
ncbi:protein phosphatase 2C domain-containing protein [Streptomyces sp. NPDC048383]|uniref:protein phosphatase 2C domain-containing protein n=1 Tax=Streptomyces sp. NPDC048383 TaxID=3155386 RepID=UPI0034220B16